MYFLMFISVMRLRRTQPDHPRGYRAPMVFVLAGVGFVSSAAAFLIGFVPSSQFGSGSTLAYVLPSSAAASLVIGLLIPFLFLRFRKPSWKNAVPAPEVDQD